MTLTFNTIVRTKVTYKNPDDPDFIIPAGTQGIVVPPDVGPALACVIFPLYRGLTVIYDVDDLEEDTKE